MSPRTRTRLLKYPAHKSTLPPLPLSSLHHTTFIRCRQSDGPNSKATFGPHPILSALSWIPWDLRRAGNGSSTLYYIQYIAVFSSTTEHGGLKLKHRRKKKNIQIDLKRLLHEPGHLIQAGFMLMLLAQWLQWIFWLEERWLSTVSQAAPSLGWDELVSMLNALWHPIHILCDVKTITSLSLIMLVVWFLMFSTITSL